MRTLSILTLLVVAPALAAQPSTPGPTTTTRAVQTMAPRSLDTLIARARRAGVPDTSVRAVVDVMTRGGATRDEALEAAEMEVVAVERGGRRDAFGQFVRSKTASGLRGRELAAAIRAEKDRRNAANPQRGGQRGGTAAPGANRPAGRDTAAANRNRPPASTARPRPADTTRTTKTPPTQGRRP
jgi:hypothetical protein